MCCLLPDPVRWLWTCHADFFPGRDPGVVSDPGMWRDSVIPLPGRPRRHEESFMSTSTQTTHINLLPSSHRQTSIHRGQRHHLWRLRVEHSPAGCAEWDRTDGGVQRPPVPKLHLSAAHLHRWGERYATSADKSLGKYQVTEMPVWAYVPNFLLIVWNFSGYASTASLTACKSLRWKRGSWAAQVPEALSHHIKASGNQKVIFDPQDPWVLVALKAFGALEDRQKTLKWYKNLSMIHFNFTIEDIKEVFLSNIRKGRQIGRLDRSWEPLTHP